jgi:hypothetical protein
MSTTETVLTLGGLVAAVGVLLFLLASGQMPKINPAKYYGWLRLLKVTAVVMAIAYAVYNRGCNATNYPAYLNRVDSGVKPLPTPR